MKAGVGVQAPRFLTGKCLPAYLHGNAMQPVSRGMYGLDGVSGVISRLCRLPASCPAAPPWMCGSVPFSAVSGLSIDFRLVVDYGVCLASMVRGVPLR